MLSTTLDQLTIVAGLSSSAMRVLFLFLTTVGALNDTQECSNVSAFVDFCFVHLQSVNFRVTALNLHSDDESNVLAKVSLFPGLCRLLERFLGKAEDGQSMCCCL